MIKNDYRYEEFLYQSFFFYDLCWSAYRPHHFYAYFNVYSNFTDMYVVFSTVF